MLFKGCCWLYESSIVGFCIVQEGLCNVVGWSEFFDGDGVLYPVSKSDIGGGITIDSIDEFIDGDSIGTEVVELVKSVSKSFGITVVGNICINVVGSCFTADRTVHAKIESAGSTLHGVDNHFWLKSLIQEDLIHLISLEGEGSISVWD